MPPMMPTTGQPQAQQPPVQQPMPQQALQPGQATQVPQPQQMSPQLLAFMHLLQQQGYGQPNLTGGAPSPQPQLRPQASPAAAGGGMRPQAGQSPVPAVQPQVGGQQRAYTPQELAAMGRLGDNAIAHLTNGEITVPPEVQTPKVLATLKSEYNKKGVDPAQFTVGSPQSSTNPQTGLHEYNFWSSFLPIALGIGGSLVLPGIGTVLGSSLDAAALGGIGAGAGTAVGDLATGKDLQQSLMGGALAGAGGYAAGSLFGGASDAASGAANSSGAAGSGGGAGSAAGNAANAVGSKAYLAASPADQVALDVAKEGGYGPAIAATYRAGIPGAVGGLAGGLLANSMFGGNTSNTSSGLPSNFNKPYTPPSQLPSFAQQLGMTTYNGPQANFTGYNPATNNPMAYNFFPTASTSGQG